MFIPDELRQALGFAPATPYTCGDWFALTGAVTGFATDKPEARPVILKEPGAGPSGIGYPRTSKRPTHEPHKASGDHPRTCRLDKRGRIVWHPVPMPWDLLDDAFSCTEYDGAVVDAVRCK